MHTAEPHRYSRKQRHINRLVVAILTQLSAHNVDITVTFTAIKDKVQSNMLSHHTPIDQLELAVHKAIKGLIGMELIEQKGVLEYLSRLPQFNWSMSLEKRSKLPKAEKGGEHDGKLGSDISVSTQHSDWSVGHMYKQLNPSQNFELGTSNSQQSIQTQSSTLSGDKFERVRKLYRTNHRKLPGAEPESTESMRKVAYTPKSISNGPTTTTTLSLTSSSSSGNEMLI